MYPDEVAWYSLPETPSVTFVGTLPDMPSEFPTPATPSRTIVRDGVFITVEPEEESEFPTPLAPSETVLYDARRDPCHVETFVDFTEPADIDMRENLWREEQEKRAPPPSGEEFRGWLDTKLDRTCRGVSVEVPDEHAPENMFYDFDDAEEKCAREAVWAEQQKEVDREVRTPCFFGWREWMPMEEPTAPPEPEPVEPRYFTDFEDEKERQYREAVWRREQMEPCPDWVLEELASRAPPTSPRLGPSPPPREICEPREISHEETFTDFPDEEEKRKREALWAEEQAKVLDVVFGEKVRCGDRPPPKPDVLPATFHDFEDNRERSERDEVWQREQTALVDKHERVFDGWLTEVQPVFSDLDGLTEEQIATRQRLWTKEQAKRFEEEEGEEFEGWEAGRDRTVTDTFHDFPDNRLRAERDAVWEAEQRKIHCERGEGFEGWLDETWTLKKPGVAGSVEMFTDFDEQRERCACTEVWHAEQQKRAPETCEQFDGWNEWAPETRVAEGEQVQETFEERSPYAPETFQDFTEPEVQQERAEIWQDEQWKRVPPEKDKAVFGGWLAAGVDTEATFWDFPDEEESCRRQKIWNEEQGKVREEVEYDECGNRIPVFHGWGPQVRPCERKEYVSPPPPQPADEPAVDYEVESILAEERESDAFLWNEYQLEQAPGARTNSFFHFSLTSYY